MNIKRTIAIIAKNELAHTSDEFIEHVHSLGAFLKKDEAVVLTHFSGSTHYFKESFIRLGGSPLSLSPACSEEEHKTIFAYDVMPGDIILYTGLGRQLSLLTLLRSVHTIVALDDGAYDEAKLLLPDADTKNNILLFDETTIPTLEVLFGQKISN